MNNFAPAPCIPDDGVEARIPGSPLSVLTLVEARERLSAAADTEAVPPEVLSDRLHLSLAQVYAALAYYHANQAAFDAEQARRRAATQQALTAYFAKQEGHNGWAEIIGKWPGVETDAEIEAALERLS